MRDNCLLPPWAIRESDGTYMQTGAHLPTRDGRICGNGYVDAIDGPYAVVVTDMGSVFRMTLAELEEAFHPPEYVMDVIEARNRRGLT